jgi:hypothetical protein
MSPLAQMIVRAAMDRRLGSAIPDALASSNCHCFEITDALPLVHELAVNTDWKFRDDIRLFLPSPMTWIEWRTGNGRNGALLVDGADKQPNDTVGIYVHEMALNNDDGVILEREDTWAMVKRDGRFRILSPLTAEGDPVWGKADFIARGRTLAAALSLINTPRIIGRRQHMPHSGLQKRLAMARGMTGKFPLQAWHEIKLEVRPPISPEGTSEGHLTGMRALHFCRAHLRIRYGKLELVHAHWRGDPSLGVKQTRYVLIPPKAQGAQP